MSSSQLGNGALSTATRDHGGGCESSCAGGSQSEKILLIAANSNGSSTARRNRDGGGTYGQYLDAALGSSSYEARAEALRNLYQQVPRLPLLWTPSRHCVAMQVRVSQRTEFDAHFGRVARCLMYTRRDEWATAGCQTCCGTISGAVQWPSAGSGQAKLVARLINDAVV